MAVEVELLRADRHPVAVVEPVGAPFGDVLRRQPRPGGLMPPVEDLVDLIHLLDAVIYRRGQHPVVADHLGALVDVDHAAETKEQHQDGQTELEAQRAQVILQFAAPDYSDHAGS